jgi:uncharacterized protein Yka (UPF0111/DUF47 family)
VIQVERRISLGNLIGLLPLLAISALWFADRHRDSEQLQETAGTVQLQANLLHSHGARITTLEKQAEDRQRDIVRRLERIEDKLDRVQIR